MPSAQFDEVAQVDGGVAPMADIWNAQTSDAFAGSHGFTAASAFASARPGRTPDGATGGAGGAATAPHPGGTLTPSTEESAAATLGSYLPV